MLRFDIRYTMLSGRNNVSISARWICNSLERVWWDHNMSWWGWDILRAIDRNRVWRCKRDGWNSIEFKERLNKGYAWLAKLGSNLNRKNLRRKLIHSVIWSLQQLPSSYGCDGRNLTKDERSKMNAFETKAYRRALNICYTEHIFGVFICMCRLQVT
jgi:hypothetical protein